MESKTATAEATKRFEPLENSPAVMDALAKRLGLSDELAFYDVCSLDDPDLLAHIPRPAYALLVVVPMTSAWERDRDAEGARANGHDGGPAATGDEPVIWFRQLITDACGFYCLLQCVVNGAAAKFIRPGRILERLRERALALDADDRSQMLYHSEEFEMANQPAGELAETDLSGSEGSEGTDLHFLAYVKANGHLWELEGLRQGPVDRGELGDDEDVLSP